MRANAVSLILGIGVFWGLVAAFVAWRRGLPQSTWTTANRYSIACVIFTQVARRQWLFGWVFVAFTATALIVGLFEIGRAIPMRRLEPRTLFGISALVGSVCALSVGRIPYAVSLTMSFLTLVTGFASLVFWFIELPTTPRASIS